MSACVPRDAGVQRILYRDPSMNPATAPAAAPIGAPMARPRRPGSSQWQLRSSAAPISAPAQKPANPAMNAAPMAPAERCGPPARRCARRDAGCRSGACEPRSSVGADAMARTWRRRAAASNTRTDTTRSAGDVSDVSPRATAEMSRSTIPRTPATLRHRAFRNRVRFMMRSPLSCTMRKRPRNRLILRRRNVELVPFVAL